MENQRADYRFIVKELPSETGSDWALECYPETKQLSCISNSGGCMYIRFKPSTSEEDAKRIRELLNEHVADFTIVEPRG